MIKNKTTRKTFKAIDLGFYGTWAIKGSYGSDKNKMVAVRIDEELEKRIKDFIEDPNSHKITNYSWGTWNRGELIRSAVTLFLDAFDARYPRKGPGKGPGVPK